MNSKILDLKTLSSLEQDQFPIGEVSLNIGEQSFLVKYQKQFKESQIQELIKEWLLIKEAVEDKIEINMYDISFILIFKHFTDVPFEQIEDILERVDHYIRVTNLLVDLKDKDGVSLFEKIFTALDKTQIEKISEAMKKVGKNILEETKRLEESEEYRELLDFIEKSEE